MDWFQTGDAGQKRAKRFDQEREKRRQEAINQPRRFWNKPDGEGRKIVFLDSDGFFFKEHNYKADGHWRNWETCIQDIGEEDCPACEQGRPFSYVCAHTVIELTEFETRQGQTVRNPKRLFVTKGTARDKLMKQKERLDGTLHGCLFEVTRFKMKECSTGEDFHCERKLTDTELEQLVPSGNNVKEYLLPYDYREVFAPKSVEELRAIFGADSPIGTEDGDPEEDQPSSSGKGSSLADVL